MLRYFDLDEIVKFIKYVRRAGMQSCYFVENYFKDIREITMTSISCIICVCLTLSPSPTGLPYTDISSQICDPERSTRTAVPGADNHRRRTYADRRSDDFLGGER
jgi:hypothetical protein